jgi:GNAT superfamily N-acetyltransferase
MSDHGGRPELTYHREDNGDTRIDLMLDGRPVSHLWIIPLTVAIGVARVRVDGIGGVETEEDCRGRGFARRTMEAAVVRMRDGDGSTPSGSATLSLLFGLPNFYEKFGYATAGPELSLSLTGLDHERQLPVGWTTRPCALHDLPAVHALYERSIARSVGAVVRRPDCRAWSTLTAVVPDPHQNECRVVVDPRGTVAAYAWRAREFWPVDTEEESPDALTIGEAIAAGPAAADALLAACRAWAVAESARRPEIARAKLYVPLDGPVYAAAMRQDATLELIWRPSGGFMVRTLSVHRLLAALEPELNRRATVAAMPVRGALRVVTELGEATLDIAPHGVAVRRGIGSVGPHGDEPLTIELPQQDLACLAFGAFSTADLLDRLAHPPDATARRWLEILFPQRYPYTHLADWV